MHIYGVIFNEDLSKVLARIDDTGNYTLEYARLTSVYAQEDISSYIQSYFKQDIPLYLVRHEVILYGSPNNNVDIWSAHVKAGILSENEELPEGFVWVNRKSSYFGQYPYSDGRISAYIENAYDYMVSR